MKIAIIQDWLTTIGGSEKVVKAIYEIYPQADIYTLIAEPTTIKKLGFNPANVKTSFIQNLPFAKKNFRKYLPLFPIAIEQFNLSQYDLIISSSHAVAKGVITNHSQVHICYCHSPIRYAWDLYHQYLKETKLNSGIKGFITKYFLHKIRIWDIIATNRVDFFISNSNYIKRRIEKIYNVKSVTIYPNVEVYDFDLTIDKDDYYFTCSRMVPYKKIDLIVKAFSMMPDKKLVVIGDGPEFRKIKKLATPNIVLLGHQSFTVLKKYLQSAKALVFAAEEDFGIVPVESQACGTPVIAFGKGGVLESVIDKETGVFYYEQTEISLIDAIERFEKMSFDPLIIRKNAEKFNTDRFKHQIKEFIDEKIALKLSYN